MKKIIFVLLIVVLLNNFVEAKEGEVFIVNLKYDKEEISLERLYLTEAYFNVPKDQPEEGYRLDVVSFNNEILYTQKFDFPLEIFTEPLRHWFDSEGNQIVIPKIDRNKFRKDTAVIEIMVPYFDKGKSIEIYDNDDVHKLSIDILPYHVKEASNFLYILLFIVLAGIAIFLKFFFRRKK